MSYVFAWRPLATPFSNATTLTDVIPVQLQNVAVLVLLYLMFLGFLVVSIGLSIADTSACCVVLEQ